ncbi:MAG: AMP-binding protein, partial [Acidimicrobiia bacterium]|nr:AMP-binding protein [Acidimicrobiia bacterium]
GESIATTADDVVISYLPLSHVAEQMSTIHIAISRAYQVYYCPDPLELAAYVGEVRPTVFFGVPRVWERFHAGIGARLAEATGAKAKIVAWARGVGSKTTALRNEGREPTGLLAVQDKLASKLVFDKLRSALGLDRTRAFVSGAAPLAVEILEFFGSLGISVLEIYGQSEDSGPTSSNLPGATRFGSVGRPLPGVEVRIGGDDEILVRGPNVFAGYFKDEEATAATLVDGWLHSGDLGRFDDDGYLFITGRAKDIIITSGGKNIAPKNIEGALTSLELVSQAVCVGEQQRFLVALLTLDPDAAARFAAEHGIAVETVHEHPALLDRLGSEIAERVNPQFARVEHIRNFAVLPEQFSIEGGELTPTFKIKRALVNARYTEQIDALYEDGQKL